MDECDALAPADARHQRGSGRQKVTSPDGTTQIVDLNPGASVWRDDAFDHSWELLVGEVHAILVEVKSAKVTTAKSRNGGDEFPMPHRSYT